MSVAYEWKTLDELAQMDQDEQLSTVVHVTADLLLRLLEKAEESGMDVDWRRMAMPIDDELSNSAKAQTQEKV